MQNLIHLPGLSFSAPYLNNSPDNISYHVLKKTIRLNGDRNQVSGPLERQPLEMTSVRFRVSPAGFKGGKIVPANENAAGPLHRRHV